MAAVAAPSMVCAVGAASTSASTNRLRYRPCSRPRLALDSAGDSLINDSELVSRQIGGEYKVKHAGLKPLFLEAMQTLRGFDAWAVRSVRREHNERADELVNQALDEAPERH